MYVYVYLGGISGEMINFGRFINQFSPGIHKIDTETQKSFIENYVDKKNVYNVLSNMYQWKNAAQIYIF